MASRSRRGRKRHTTGIIITIDGTDDIGVGVSDGVGDGIRDVNNVR